MMESIYTLTRTHSVVVVVYVWGWLSHESPLSLLFLFLCVNFTSAMDFLDLYDAETALFEQIKDAVPSDAFDKITTLFYGVRSESRSYSQAAAETHDLLLERPDLWTELDAYMQDGTHLYIYTKPGVSFTFRPHIKVSDLACDWNVSGDNFSKCCAICLNAFTPPIRTLECKHTYCQSCLEEYLARKGIVLEEGDETQEVLCPYCKQTNELSATVDSAHERAHNSLLLTLQEHTLKYKCPIEGCGRTFTRGALEAHLEVCAHRKYVCPHGCEAVRYKGDLHDNPRVCIRFLQDKVTRLAQDSREKSQKIMRLEDRLWLLSDSDSDASESETRSTKRRHT
jgi:hypothetical protein